mmetsp:Transcript_20809/g.38899  ORF Transcript_20809/g.38899 Transcript_20809/m.38899 type:complete len:477 (+) Transcript_20809:197-1627(+)
MSSFTSSSSPTESFNRSGFYISPIPLFTPSEVSTINSALESIIRHEYSTSVPPTKPCPKINAPENPSRPLGFTGNHANVKTLQVVNSHLSSSPLSSLLHSPHISEFVGYLTGWPSVRYIQDQAWLKPPSSSSLSFHRDRPYIPLRTNSPQDNSYHNNVKIVTVWITLDDIEEESGGLEYAVGSHMWRKVKDGRCVGANEKFFEKEGYRYFADKMGGEEGIDTVEYKNTVGMKAGHGAYHDGDTYHGSGRNSSMTLPRRGIGIHFSRGDVEWEVEEAGGSKIWKKYVENGETELDENVFPIVWRRKTDKEWEDKIKNEKPSIKTALKNLMTARIATEGPAVDKLRLMQVAAKFVISTVNSGVFVWPATGSPMCDDDVEAEVCYRLYDKIKSVPNAKVSELMSSSFLKLGPVKKALYDYKSKGVKSLSDDEVYYVKGFVEEFLETVENREELVWTEDLSKEIAKRGKERVERGKAATS